MIFVYEMNSLFYDDEDVIFISVNRRCEMPHRASIGTIAQDVGFGFHNYSAPTDTDETALTFIMENSH